MGLWDNQIVDLEALGIRFSDLEVDLLTDDEVSGFLVHLHQVLDPSTCCGEPHTVFDPEGQPVMVAEIIEIVGPYYPVDRYDRRGNRDGVEYLHEQMERVHGSVTSEFPWYFGLLDDCGVTDFHTADQAMREDEYYPYPFWTCLPATDLDAAKRLVKASQRRLADSIYPAYWYYSEFEEESEWCCDIMAMWRAVRCNIPLDDEQKVQWRYYLDSFIGKDKQARKDHIGMLLSCYEDLVAAGICKDPRDPPGPEVEFEGLALKPIEAFLQDDPVALGYWHDIRSRMLFMGKRYEALYGTRARHELNRLEDIG